MKKSVLSEKAAQLYVEELWTFEAIAKEIGCSERAVRTWAKDGRWELKRKNFITMRENISDDVRKISMLLAKRITSQLEDEIEPSPHVLNAFTRMASSLLNVRKYEKEIEQEYACLDNDSNSQDKELAAAKFKEVFGIDL